jgi:hypothetical protein
MGQPGSCARNRPRQVIASSQVCTTASLVMPIDESPKFGLIKAGKTDGMVAARSSELK